MQTPEMMQGQLSFGTGPLGNLFGKVRDADARATIERAFDLGLRHFDTAPHYGRGLGERRLGDVLRSRSGYTLSTKVGRLMRPDASWGEESTQDGFMSPLPFRPEYDYTADGILRSHEASLHRLGLARIDLLLVHDIGTMNHGAANARYWEQLTKGGGFQALQRLREEGSVGGIGLGVNETEICLAAMREVHLDKLLIAGRYTLLDQTALNGLLAACLSVGTEVLLGAPFNSGVLVTGVEGPATPFYDYAPAPAEIIERVRRIAAIAETHEVPLAAVALQFPLAHPAVTSVVAGFRDPAQVEQALSWMAQSIPADFWAELRKESLVRADAPLPALQVGGPH
jgi:D-threo-aldose 1-dehydrogenase